VQRGRALVEIFKSANNKPAAAQPTGTTTGKPPLSSRLNDFPAGGVDLENIVTYPPRLEPFPVKPLFLDVAWNYITYPGKDGGGAEQQPQQAGAAAEGAAATAGGGRVEDEGDDAGAGGAEETKPQQKRGWFGFGRS
jgi:signal recognition particle subunit SRP68